MPRTAVDIDGNDDNSGAVHDELPHRMDLHCGDEEVLPGTELTAKKPRISGKAYHILQTLGHEHAVFS